MPPARESRSIVGRSERIFEPSSVGHAALENEEFLVRRDTREKPFQGVSDRHAPEIGLLLPGEVLSRARTGWKPRQPDGFGAGRIE